MQACSRQTSFRNLLFQLIQCISLHFKSPDLYLFCTTKVFPKFLLLSIYFQSEEFGPMTMRNGRCHWSRALYQILVCLLMQKRHLFVKRIRWIIGLIILFEWLKDIFLFAAPANANGILHNRVVFNSVYIIIFESHFYY